MTNFIRHAGLNVPISGLIFIEINDLNMSTKITGCLHRGTDWVGGSLSLLSSDAILKAFIYSVYTSQNVPQAT